jgi:molybdenum cofactor cytidylyltransferase
MLLPWRGTSILGHLIAQWQSLRPEQIAVVCPAANKVIEVELDRLGFLHENRIGNPTPEQGMFSSVQCAARWSGWLPNLTHWILALGDQPHLRTATLCALLEFAAAHPRTICQPSRNGRPRHPVVLPAAAFQQLRDAAFPNLKAFLQARIAETALRATDDPGLDFDIDEPADYEKAVQLFSRTV